MRSKEMALDYRYFPEPDTMPFEFTDAYVEEIRARLPELPDARVERLRATYGLSDHDARLLGSELGLVTFFEESVAAAGTTHIKAVANMILNDLGAYLNATDETFETIKIGAAHIAELVDLVARGIISSKQSKDVFGVMIKTGHLPAAIVADLGLKQVSDSGALEEAIAAVLAAHPDKVEQYRSGKSGLLGFFMGQVMKETGGQANPKLAGELLGKMLEG
jgi:aspartyl-tRNA(Asn)/glutamyl-tRNA(Gln) amidotransferase subunit B